MRFGCLGFTDPACMMAKAYVPALMSEGICTLVEVPDTDVANDFTGRRLLDDPVSRMISTSFEGTEVSMGISAVTGLSSLTDPSPLQVNLNDCPASTPLYALLVNCTACVNMGNRAANAAALEALRRIESTDQCELFKQDEKRKSLANDEQCERSDGLLGGKRMQRLLGRATYNDRTAADCNGRRLGTCKRLTCNAKVDEKPSNRIFNLLEGRSPPVTPTDDASHSVRAYLN